MKLEIKPVGHFFEGEYFRIGKYKGEHIGDIIEKDRKYVEWVYNTTENDYDSNLIDEQLGTY